MEVYGVYGVYDCMSVGCFRGVLVVGGDVGGVGCVHLQVWSGAWEVGGCMGVCGGSGCCIGLYGERRERDRERRGWMNIFE